MRKTKLLALMLAAVMFGGLIFASCTGGNGCGDLLGGGGTYSVTFDANGGAGAPAKLTGVEKGTKIEEPDVSGMTRDGFDFKGWYKDKGAAAKWNFESDTVTSNLTLYAGWNDMRLNVALTSEGKGQIAGAGKFAKDSAVTVTATPDDGWYFEGWYENNAGTITFKSRQESFTFNIVADITLKAVFVAEVDDVDTDGNIVMQLNRAYTIDEYTTFAFTAEVAGFYAFYTYDETPRGEVQPWIGIYQTSDFNGCIGLDCGDRVYENCTLTAGQTVYIIAGEDVDFDDGYSYKFVARYLGETYNDAWKEYFGVYHGDSEAVKKAFDNATAMTPGKEYWTEGETSFFKFTAPEDGIYTFYTANDGQAYPYFEFYDYSDLWNELSGFGNDGDVWDGPCVDYVLYKGADYFIFAYDSAISANFRIGVKAYTPDIANAVDFGDYGGEALSGKTLFKYTPEYDGVYQIEAYDYHSTSYVIFYDADVDFVRYREYSIYPYMSAGKIYYFEVRELVYGGDLKASCVFDYDVAELAEGAANAEEITGYAEFVFFPETDDWYTFKVYGVYGDCDTPQAWLSNSCWGLIDEDEGDDLIILARLKAGKAYLIETCAFDGDFGEFGGYYLKAEKADPELIKFIDYINGVQKTDNYTITVSIMIEGTETLYVEVRADENGIYIFDMSMGGWDRYYLKEGGDYFAYEYDAEDEEYKIYPSDKATFDNIRQSYPPNLFANLIDAAKSGTFAGSYDSNGGFTATFSADEDEGTITVSAVGSTVVSAPANAELT